MKKQEQISVFQFGILVMLFTIGSSILITPSGLAAEAKQSAWIPALLGIMISPFIICIYTLISKELTSSTFFEFCEATLGKWLGNFVVLLYSFFGFITAATLLWVLSTFLMNQIFINTPDYVIQGMFSLVILYATKVGIVSVARSAEIFAFWVIILFVFLCVCLTPLFDNENLQPILDVNMKPVIRASISYLSVACTPLVLLLILFSSITKQRDGRKVYFIGNFLGGLVLLITSLITILVLGADLTANQLYPTYVVAKKINIGNFLSRVEVIIAILWLLTIFYKTYLYFYAAIIGITHVFRLGNSRYISTPLTFLLLIVSVDIYPNMAFAAQWDVETWIPFSFTFGLALPILLLFISFFKRKMNKQKHSS